MSLFTIVVGALVALLSIVAAWKVLYMDVPKVTVVRPPLPQTAKEMFAERYRWKLERVATSVLVDGYFLKDSGGREIIISRTDKSPMQWMLSAKIRGVPWTVASEVFEYVTVPKEHWQPVTSGYWMILF